MFLCTKGFLSICFSIISMYPFFSIVLNILLFTSVKISKSEIYIPSFSIKNLKTLICLSLFIFPFSISFSISSTSFFKNTKLPTFSLALFASSFPPVPGGSINFIQSEILQKYFLAISLARVILFSVKDSSISIFAISFKTISSFLAISDSSFKLITKPSSSFFPLPNGTKTLAPTFMVFSISFGTT